MHSSILERRKLKAAALAVMLTTPIACFESASNAAVINGGDLVVEQVGNGSAPLANTSTAVFLDIYTPVVGANNVVTLTPESTPQIALPTVLSSNGLASNPFTTSGTATSEGQITLSPDGSAIALSGYDANTGVGANGMSNNTSSVAGSNSAIIAREIGLVYTATGAVDTSTTTTAFNGNNPRAAVLANATTIYAAGAATPGLTQITADTSNANGVQLENTIVNIRTVQIFNGNIYISDSSGSVVNVAQVNGYTGTANSGTAAQLPGLSVSNNATQNTSGTKVFSAYEIAFADGGNTLYVADQGSNGNNGSGTGAIEKFILSAGSWSPDGFVAIGTSNVTGLAVESLNGPSGAFDAIFATTPSEIYEISDAGGSLTGDILNGVQAVGTNEAFRGILAVPEPSSLSLLALTAGAGLLRRRRRCVSLGKR